MIQIRNKIFETNSSSSDYYSEPDDSIEYKFEYGDAKGYIVFQENESVSKILEYLMFCMVDFIDEFLEDYKDHGVRNIVHKDNVISFTYDVICRIDGIMIRAGRACNTEDKWCYSYTIENHIPYKSEEFKDINDIKQKIIDDMTITIFDFAGNLDIYDENRSVSKEVWEAARELKKNPSIFKILDIYTDEITDDDLECYEGNNFHYY